MSLLACQVRVTVDDAGLGCCVSVTSFERCITPFMVEVTHVRHHFSKYTLYITDLAPIAKGRFKKQYLIHVYMFMDRIIDKQ